MDAKKILLVDDDTNLGNMLTIGLQHMGFEVYYQSSFTSIIPIINEVQPSIIVLDVEIGIKDGIDESERIMRLFSQVPIIFISSHTDPEYVERAMKIGSVNYLKKPFHIKELAAIVNRFAKNEATTIAVGNVTLNPDTQIIHNITNSKQCKLSLKECKLLMLLINNMEEPVSRTMIEKFVWGADLTTEAIINNTISRLRKYIEIDTTLNIRTVSKIGYMLTLK